jgi:hypothetical protein
MNPRKGLDLDADILMRAVLGRRVRELLDWTEDQDLFGSGVAAWTTDRVELFLRQDEKGTWNV